ncbi:hypothetical protein WHR41_00764 [Cladosporium halotolerans]|uniref:Cytochrome P450 n=1 Tax=Cladosporium halotolerans TaxID=1052096 RepID=A0AB34L2U0_9PEZI
MTTTRFSSDFSKMALGLPLSPLLQPFLILLLTYLSYTIVTTFLSRARFRAFARQHGCVDPHDASGPFPYGLQLIRRIARSQATGEDVLDDILLPQFQGKQTIKKTVLDGQTMLLTTEPANLQAMLANQFSDFETGANRRAVFHPLLGNSIFSSDGAAWKHARALLRPSFSRDSVNNLAFTSQSADALIAALGEPDAATGWTPARDAQPLFLCFTMDTATEFLFGRSVGALEAVLGGGGGEGAEAASGEFGEALRVAGDYLITRIRLGGLYWVADGWGFRRAAGRVRRFVEGFVGRAVEKAEKGGGGGGGEFGLLEALVAQTKDKEDLVSQSLAVMFAGRDTTAGLLGWCLMRLALHPDVFESLRAAVLREIPAAEQPTFSQLKGCRPLQHFLQEVLRLHSTVPFNNRVAIRDTTLPVGGGPDQSSPVAVRKGQVVTFSVYAMHRRTDLWGEDALEFRPSRFEVRVPAWQWLPFLGGPRVCLGQQFALTEAGFLLVRLLREFDQVQPVDEVEMKKMRKGLGLTMWPADGVKVRLHKAESQ